MDEEKTESGIDPGDLKMASADESAPAADDFSDEAVAMSDDVPVKMIAVLGRKKMVLKDLLRLKIGQAIDFERPPNEFVDLVANGKLIAKGELVEIDGKLGVRIIKMVK